MLHQDSHMRVCVCEITHTHTHTHTRMHTHRHTHTHTCPAHNSHDLLSGCFITFSLNLFLIDLLSLSLALSVSLSLSVYLSLSVSLSFSLFLFIPLMLQPLHTMLWSYISSNHKHVSNQSKWFSC